MSGRSHGRGVPGRRDRVRVVSKGSGSRSTGAAAGMVPPARVPPARVRRGARMVVLGWAAAAVAVAMPVAGCRGSSESCTLASEGCACTSMGACDPGLICASSHCVRPPGGGAGGGAGGSGAGGAGAGGTAAPGTGGGGGQGGTPGPGGGVAQFKLCNSNENDIEVTLGSVRRLVGKYTCEPSINQPCLTLPAGPTPLSMQVKSQTFDLGSLNLTAGQSTVTFPIHYPTKVVPVAAGATCAGTSYEQAVIAFPADRGVVLRPTQVKAITVGSPVGWQVAASPDARIVFKPAAAGSGPLDEVHVHSAGTAPGERYTAADYLGMWIAREGMQLVGAVEPANGYAAATARTGAGGFARVAFTRTMGAMGEGWVTLAQVVARSEAALRQADAPVTALNLAFGIGAPGDITAADLVGKWGVATMGTDFDYFDDYGAWLGMGVSGRYLQIELGADGSYNLGTMAATTCSLTTPGCVVRGFLTFFERGRYAYDAGLLALERRSCISRWYNEHAVVESASVCGQGTTPVLIRVRRAAEGQLELTGLALDPLGDEGLQSRVVRKK
jgi:hypothetical protein